MPHVEMVAPTVTEEEKEEEPAKGKIVGFILVLASTIRNMDPIFRRSFRLH